ncbi:arginase [Paenibacillus koleovorans]|uniref:arginase n=1 Tax=Paenibacillus koleovorans TaxID=121608 RepID=UPI000FDC4A9F|nr:arginase [Paenibacillus koleovorans]
MAKSATIQTISVPFDLGAGRRGARLGPEAIREAGLEKLLGQLGFICAPVIEVAPPVAAAGGSVATPATTQQLRYLQEVLDVNRRLADSVADTVAADRFPLVLGGDHSLAIGSIAGLGKRYKRLGLLWIDAHSDLNTEHTTPSGNIHGMSLAVGLGLGHPALTGIRGSRAKLKPEHVALIGARSLDPEERAFIRAEGIACYTMHDIDRLGMARVMEEAIARVSRGTDGVHLSFDVDSLDPREAPGTGTPVNGGLSYREAHLALELLHEAGLVTSAEFVEVNPTLDAHGKTAQLAVELIGSLLGDRIL